MKPNDVISVPAEVFTSHPSCIGKHVDAIVKLCSDRYAVVWSDMFGHSVLIDRNIL